MRAFLIRAGVLAMAGGLCWFGARQAADYVENSSFRIVQAALTASGQSWAGIRTDGLRVLLSGTAPSEADRFRALTVAGDVIYPGRIADEMTVAAPVAGIAPEFSIELLRNQDGISLIGIVPASTDRQALISLLTQQTAAPQVTDLLESADYPPPQDWAAALDFGTRAVSMTPHAKISVAPGKVGISALVDSAPEKERLLSELKRAAPPGVELQADISAPRPVIAPFTLRFSINDGQARLEACAADNQSELTRITQAAVNTGHPGRPGCTLALGSPSPDWADVSVAAIKAVAALGQGTVTISDADVFLHVPADTELSAFNKTVASLKAALPPVFSLQAVRERPADVQNEPAEFTATLTADNTLTINGEIAGQQMHDAVGSFAQARFAAVQDNLVSDPDVPEGWTVKIIAGIEAIGILEHGQLKITPDVIELTGTSGNADATVQVASVLARRLGPGARYHLSIRYDSLLDPDLALPEGDGCVSRLNTIMSEAAIGFEPGSSRIAGDPAETLTRLSAVMADCKAFRIEVGGHTDSQGSSSFNTDLSRDRAKALITAMAGAGITTANLTSRGYGESQPIASNETEEGREENRRIEFRLVSEVPVRDEPLPAPDVVDAVTAATAPPPAQPLDDTAAGPEPAAPDDQVPATAPPLPVDTTGNSAGITTPRALDQSTYQSPPKPALPVADDTPDDSEATEDEPL